MFVAVGKHYINLDQIAYVAPDVDHKDRRILLVTVAGNPVPRLTIPHEYTEAFEDLLRAASRYQIDQDGYTLRTAAAGGK